MKRFEFYTKPSWLRGATDNGGPGYREDNWAGYCAAFVIVPDRHNIEAAYWDYDKAGEKGTE